MKFSSSCRRVRRQLLAIDQATAALLIFSIGILGVTGAIAADLLVPPAAVSIDNFSFGREPLRIPVGTKVTWTNQDDIPHTVREDAENPTFKSPPLDTGDTFSFIFGRPGTYRYFCSIHPKMQSTVTVTSAK